MPQYISAARTSLAQLKMPTLKHKLAKKLILALTLSVCTISSCVTKPVSPELAVIRAQIDQALSPLGGQNWIVIAESAYPAYASTSIETLTIPAPAEIVLAEVLDSLEVSAKTQPRIYLPSEMQALTERHAPGIKQYRKNLNKLIPGRLHYKLSNKTIQDQIENANRRFRVLVLKTNTNLPYSNIYISLDSAYWDSEAEAHLQEVTNPYKPVKRITAPEEVPSFIVPLPPPTILQQGPQPTEPETAPAPSIIQPNTAPPAPNQAPPTPPAPQNPSAAKKQASSHSILITKEPENNEKI